MSRGVASGRNIEFVFDGLGRLSFRQKKVKMKFFKEFVNTLEESPQIFKAMSNRPFTADSVMTDRPLSRPFTSNTILLPRADADGRLPAIPEDDALLTNRETTAEKSELEKTSSHSEVKQNEVIETTAPVKELQFASDDKNVAYTPAPSSSPPTLRRQKTLPASFHTTNTKSADLSARADSQCGHSSGKHICYVCHQRARRNQSLDLRAEREKRDKEEERLLQQYQQLRDNEAIIKEQEKEFESRQILNDIASYNLGVADAIRTEKAKKPQFHNSFVLRQRPPTPDKELSQTKYYSELNNQVDAKHNESNKREQDKMFLEKLEQIQLAEDISAQREAHINQKMQQRIALQKALDTQIKFKPIELPKAVPDSDEPIFGKNDATNNEKTVQRILRARETQAHLKSTIDEKKKEAILQSLLEHKEEEEMLKRVKSELRDDHRYRFNKTFNKRKALEEDWLRAMALKQEREMDEYHHQQSGGALLLEGDHVAERCNQCQKRFDHPGGSNIWKESFYIPGSRIIV